MLLKKLFKKIEKNHHNGAYKLGMGMLHEKTLHDCIKNNAVDMLQNHVFLIFKA